jgi:hypothetical protein
MITEIILLTLLAAVGNIVALALDDVLAEELLTVITLVQSLDPLFVEIPVLLAFP